MTQPIYNYTPISPPGFTQDTVTGINNLGEIVGSNPSGYPGEVFTYGGGSYTTFFGPGPVTITGGINDLGQFVGYSHLVTDYIIDRAFLYNGSTFQDIVLPQVGGGLFGSRPTGINNSDQIVGNPAFLDSGGNFTDLNGPPNGISNAGEIVGYYYNNGFHGYLYNNGTYTTLDDPLATNRPVDTSINGSPTLGTVATAINDLGEIVGYYNDALGTRHGFLYSHGTYVTLDNPAGTAGTYLTGINNNGQIVGDYIDNNGTHGFLATVAFSPDDAGTIAFTAEYGTAPSADELNNLINFVTPQYAYGQQIGVMDPAVYAYEALGVALAPTATQFQNTFGPSNPTYPASPAGDAQFAADAYASVFGHSAGPDQIQHFVDQLNYLEGLYTAAGVFGNNANIDLLARGAVYGQMLGIEHEIDPTAIIGISTTTAHSV
jgi:probable HAF family extracellular repeat protein